MSGLSTHAESTGVRLRASMMAPPIAKAYVRAIGAKITPSAPLSTKSG